LGGSTWWFVINKVGIILVSIAAKKAVVALEAAAEGPTIVGAGGAGLFGGREMPLAHRVGVVAVHQQDFGEEAVLEGDDAI